MTVCTGDGTACMVALEQFTKDSVTGRIVERLENQTETDVQIVLYQGMPKGDKLELIIQKCTELGVSAVVPVETGRSIVHLDNRAKQPKNWNGGKKSRRRPASRVSGCRCPQ